MGTRRFSERDDSHQQKRGRLLVQQVDCQQPQSSRRRLFLPKWNPKVKPYMDSGQLKTFEGATEFFPGFRSEPAYGHTAGLTGLHS